jgi:hypothetical protein
VPTDHYGVRLITPLRFFASAALLVGGALPAYADAAPASPAALTVPAVLTVPAALTVPAVLTPVAALTPPTPQISGPLVTTAASYPFNAADHNVTPLDLLSYGYAEEEYIVSGTANVYGWQGSGLSIGVANSGPYSTRILVRKPTSQARFSGNVVVEALNPSYGFDLDYIWAAEHTQLLFHDAAARGDAWVGITVKPSSITALQRFNPGRYGTLSMANPLPLSDVCSNLAPEFTATTEQGLEWDVISQVGATLKSNQAPSPLDGLVVQQVYAAGYSRGANDLVTYANAFGKVVSLPNGKPVYDGYLLGAAVGGPSTISQCATWYAPGDPHSVVQPNRVPIIRVNTQSDFGWWFGAPKTGVSAASTLNRRPDHDGIGDQFRLYEIPGASHLWRYPEQFFPNADELSTIGAGVVGYTCSEPVGNTFPLQYFLNGALANLDRWSRTGTPPVRGDRIALNNAGTNAETTLTDGWGNALGGVRSPFVDAPRATYTAYSSGGGCGAWGHQTTFASSLLTSTYPGQSYVSQVTRGTLKLLAAGWLTPTDAHAILNEAQQAST